MADFNQIAIGCVNPIMLAAFGRQRQYIFEGYVRWGLAEQHIIERVAAALREADAAGEAMGVAAERERCAGIADEAKRGQGDLRDNDATRYYDAACGDIATEIRASIKKAPPECPACIDERDCFSVPVCLAVRDNTIRAGQPQPEDAT